MIVLEDVHKRFGEREVIRGVSMEVQQGEVVCIIGPSGSGKSTLLRCINGLETHEQGRILLGGEVVDPAKPSIKRLRTEVSMVFQRFNLFPHRTALENVIEGPIWVKKEPRQGNYPPPLVVQSIDQAVTTPRMVWNLLGSDLS
jgi:polar amino acid transport system ATP-binding protein